MIFGIGTDMVRLERIGEVHAKYGERFVERLLLPAEVEAFRSYNRPVRFLAMRFAAKEAISKCFTTGIGRSFGWKTASIAHGERHEPWVVLDEGGRELLTQIGGTRVLVSLSHTQTVAMAVAAIVRQ